MRRLYGIALAAFLACTFQPSQNVRNIPPKDARPYRVYTALLTQQGEAAPQAEVLENTLGFDLVWIRDDPGTYHCEDPTNTEQRHIFPFDKTTYTIAPGYGVHRGVDQNLYGVEVFVTDTHGNLVNGGLSYTYFEIRVYN